MCMCVCVSGRHLFSHIEFCFKLGKILGKLKDKLTEQTYRKIVLFLVEPRNRQSESRALRLEMREREWEKERERGRKIFVLFYLDSEEGREFFQRIGILHLFGLRRSLNHVTLSLSLHLALLVVWYWWQRNRE